MPLNDAASSLVGPVQNPWNTGGSGSVQQLPGTPQVSSGNPYATSGAIGGYTPQSGQQALNTAQGRNDPGQRNVLQQAASGNLTTQRETVRQQYPGSYFSPNGDLMVPEGGNTFGQTTYRIINNGAVNETARTLALQQNNPYQGTMDLMRNEVVQNQGRAQQQYERVDQANSAALQNSQEGAAAIRDQSQRAGQELRGERDAATGRSEQAAAGVRNAATLNTDSFYGLVGEAATSIRNSIQTSMKAIADFKDTSAMTASSVGKAMAAGFQESVKQLYNPSNMMDPAQRADALFNLQTTFDTQRQQAQTPIFQQFNQSLAQLQMGLSQTQAQAGQQFNNLANSVGQVESQRTEFASRGATTSAQIVQQDIANRQAYNQGVASLEAAGLLQSVTFSMNGLVGYAQALQNNPPPQLAIGAGLLQIASVEESGFGRVNMPSMTVAQGSSGRGGNPYGGNPYGGDQYDQPTPQQQPSTSPTFSGPYQNSGGGYRTPPNLVEQNPRF